MTTPMHTDRRIPAFAAYAQALSEAKVLITAMELQPSRMFIQSCSKFLVKYGYIHCII
jgi:hypothetical protein